MTTREALLAAILDDPDDDTARLVYADCIEEQGKRERAELIRVQVELAQLKVPPLHSEDCAQSGGKRWQTCARCCHSESRRDSALRERQGELLTPNYGLRWAMKELAMLGWFKSGAMVGSWKWSRGFVSHLSCTCADFLTHAATIWRENPVTGVSLTDKRPEDVNTLRTHLEGRWMLQWYGRDDYNFDAAWRLPRPIIVEMFKLKRHADYYHTATEQLTNLYYNTEQEANETIGMACVQLGRARARAARGTVGVGT